MKEDAIKRPIGCYKLIVIACILSLFGILSVWIGNEKEFLAVAMGIAVNLTVIMTLQWRIDEHRNPTPID